VTQEAEHQYRLRPKAGDDIAEIFRTIDEDNPQTADRFIAELEKTLQLLALMPGLGTVRRLRGRLKGLRSWPLTTVGPYVVFYLPRSGGIEVVRVIHGARDINRQLRDS
jgi:toxin ParE1/3/4